MPLDDASVIAIRESRVRDPFSVLGMHREGGAVVVRAWIRDATIVSVIPLAGGAAVALARRSEEGLFEGQVGVGELFAYVLEVTWSVHSPVRRMRDPYSFWPQLADFDLQRFAAGQHHHIGDLFGAHPMEVDGVMGVRFAVWAPCARRVSVVGDWNGFDGRWHPMRPREPYGVWELFLPGIEVGAKYKFEIVAPDGELRIKADPYAQTAEQPPATASVVWQDGAYHWRDADWIALRTDRNHLAHPMAVYECHIGSWQRGLDGQTWPNYRTLAPLLVAHCRRFHFTHVEFLPLAQHPYEGSWGYQVTGQYAPNCRHGTPDDLRHLIDELHLAGIGVIIDFVPGHFPKDDFALARFDGTPCYEYGDPKEGEHKGWGTQVFNFRRPEVRNYLIGAALHWIRSFHIDGLRVDAVSSMLYRDYDREAGEWVANEHGGNENLEAVTFLQELVQTVRDLHRGVVTIAEESTAWKGVTAPTTAGGLGFDLKWNMGWMHDTLRYLAQDAIMRPGCHDWITFHQWYAYDDRWVLPLSHDEVVHGKHSLVDKTPGDWWQRCAHLRLLLGWQAAVPGRPLLFQGGEFGQGREWDWDRRVDWDESDQVERRGLMAFCAAALGLYGSEPALHRRDDHRDGFAWVDCENRQESVVAFLRRAPGVPDILVACNFTPVPRRNYLIGASESGTWTEILNSDDVAFGGSGVMNTGAVPATAEPLGAWPARLRLTLPPLGLVFLRAPGRTGNGRSSA